MEVGLPTGYSLEKEFLLRILRTEGVKLVETKKSDSIAVIYIEQMVANEEKCLKVDGFRTHKVAEQKPVAVKIYDYYDSCECRYFPIAPRSMTIDSLFNFSSHRSRILFDAPCSVL